MLVNLAMVNEGPNYLIVKRHKVKRDNHSSTVNIVKQTISKQSKSMV